jgi:hypothetical protein
MPSATLKDENSHTAYMLAADRQIRREQLSFLSQ